MDKLLEPNLPGHCPLVLLTAEFKDGEFTGPPAICPGAKRQDVTQIRVVFELGRQIYESRCPCFNLEIRFPRTLCSQQRNKHPTSVKVEP